MDNVTSDNAEPAPTQTLAAHPRPIRSYVLRAGRTTTGQARALAELGPRFVLPFDPAVTDLAAACRNGFSEVVLEIGFGMGGATAHIAALRPGALFIGCEVHEPGVGALLRLIGEQELDNIRIVRHDAVDVLTRMVAPGTLDGLHIFFPDPWHKKRHHKRRLIQPPFARLAAGRLKPGGYLHCATDWEPYARQMLAVLSAEPLLANTSSAADGYAPRPEEPLHNSPRVGAPGFGMGCEAQSAAIPGGIANAVSWAVGWR
jgi:tRNA (guanine-N7-)-methyltransferase